MADENQKALPPIHGGIGVRRDQQRQELYLDFVWEDGVKTVTLPRETAMALHQTLGDYLSQMDD